jgi:hypothetical protein
MCTSPLRPRVVSALNTLVALAICAGSSAAFPQGGTAPAVRDLYTDRPDKTESPYTVPAGRLQLEVDLVSFTRHSAAGVRSTGWDVVPFNIKFGVTHNVDLQVLVRSYYSERTEFGGSRPAERHAGSGDVTARLKLNLLGNDAGRWAVGVMPFVKIPVDRGGAGNDGVEGGVIVPVATQLGHGWALGFMTRLDVLRNEGSGGHHVSFVNSVTAGHDITARLAGYVEFYTEVRQRAEGWVGTVDVGLTYGLTPDVQLDAGMNRGVTRAATDFNPFLGVSWRF